MHIAHRPRRNQMVLLLLLLAGCRAERAAFQFQPISYISQPLIPSLQIPLASPDSVVLAAMTPESGEASAGKYFKAPLKPVHTSQQRLVAAARQTPLTQPQLLSVIADRPSAPSTAKPFQRAAHLSPQQGAVARPGYWGKADIVVALFLLCLASGPLFLIVALITQSGVLAAIGVAMLFLAFILFSTYPKHK